MGLEQHRRDICRLLGGVVTDLAFDDATFDRTAPSFDNPDFVPVVIHSYRHRHGNAPGDPRFDEVERRLARPPITVPTVCCTGRMTVCHYPAVTRVTWNSFRQRQRAHVANAAISPANSPAQSWTRC